MTTCDNNSSDPDTHFVWDLLLSHVSKNRGSGHKMLFIPFTLLIKHIIIKDDKYCNWIKCIKKEGKKEAFHIHNSIIILI